MTEPRSLVDLFAGCGGMTAGFVAAGFKPVLSVERDPAAAATYAANFGEDHVFCGDIRDLDPAAVPHADVVIGGPPCQGFSGLGQRDPGDARSHLWREYLRVVARAQPKVFVIENVPLFLGTRAGRSAQLQSLLDEVEAGSLFGYELSYGVVNTADYGIAQTRKRAIVIGSRIGRIPLPAPTHARAGDKGFLPWVGIRKRIFGLPAVPETSDLPDRTTRLLGRTVRGPFRTVELHIGRNPKPQSLERYSYIRPGGNRFDLPFELQPQCWQKKSTGTADVMGRMEWDSPAPTIRTEFYKPEKGRYLHPQWDEDQQVNRPITHLEAARLMDFPDDFKWCGSKVEIARQIGNAVPVGMATVLGRHVAAHLDKAPDLDSLEGIGTSSTTVGTDPSVSPRVRAEDGLFPRAVSEPRPLAAHRGEDVDVDLAFDHFSLDVSTRMGTIIRRGTDEVIATARTRRWTLEQCDDQERAYVGANIRNLLLSEYDLHTGLQGNTIDVRGVQVEYSWSQAFGDWHVGREDVGRIHLLVHGDDVTGLMAVGLVRVKPEILDDRGDRRMGLRSDCLNSIRWLVQPRTRMPENLLMALGEQDRDAILRLRSSSARARELFTRCEGVVLHRHAIEALGGVVDPARRYKLTLRDLVRDAGLEVLNGHWKADRQRALALARVELTSGDQWVSVRTDGSTPARNLARQQLEHSAP